MEKYECSLSSDCYRMAENEFGETKQIREQCLSEIIKWLNDNPNINNGNPDIKNILYFLRGCKFNVDESKKKIEMFYKIRSQRPEWFMNRNPCSSKLAELLDLGCFLPLRFDDHNNNNNNNNSQRIFIIRAAAHNPKIHKQDDVFKIGKMLVDLAMHLDEAISIYGYVAIFDMKDVTLSHALQLQPSLVKRAVQCWDSYPCMARELEFINAPSHVNVILNTFRLFMSTQMKERVFVTTKGKSKYLTDAFPKELGGTGDDYQQLIDYWKNQAQIHQNWFFEQEKYKSN